MSLWTRSLRAQKEHVKAEWMSGLVPIGSSQVKLFMCVAFTQFLSRIGLEASENELTCCHLPEKSFGIICEFHLPVLSLSQFLWLIKNRLHVIFTFVEESCGFLLSARHPSLVISIFQSKSHWVMMTFLNSFSLSYVLHCIDPAQGDGCSFPAWGLPSQAWFCRIYYPYHHLSGFGVITHPTMRHLYPNGQGGKGKQKKWVSRVIHLTLFTGLPISIKCRH